MKDEGKPIIFYAMSIFAGIWFFIWSIANFADCNGFVMVSDNFAADRGAAGGIGIVVALGSLLVCILAFANGLFFYRR